MTTWFRDLRPLIPGILLTPLCCYWAKMQEIDRIFSLMVPLVALTMVVAVLNVPVRRPLLRIALTGGRLRVVLRVDGYVRAATI